MGMLVAERGQDSGREREEVTTGAATLPLCEETPVTVLVNDREIVTLLCTPRDLRD